MKNYKKIAVLLLVGVFLLTGCGKKDPFKTAQEKMRNLDNYHMTMNMTLGMKSSGIEMEIPVTMEMDADEKNKMAKMETSVSFFGMKMTTESYLDSRDEKKTIAYEKDTSSDTWKKTEDTEKTL